MELGRPKVHFAVDFWHPDHQQIDISMEEMSQ